ncbi:MAG: DNA translocase FtsK 4TM domain-containing protein [Bacteroidaceae bacterium]|nr:DNA translocase FtsK 4TM domain-containing protein [Bacteroidaceae bacterium]
MAGKQSTINNKSKSKLKKGSTPDETYAEVVLGGGVKDFLFGEKFRSAVGFILLGVALLLFVAFVSNMRHGYLDLSNLENGTLEQAKNACGVLGARVSHYFMQGCFGVSAFFIPIFLTFMGLKLVKAYHIVLRKCFVQCTLLMVWSSVMLSLLGRHVVSGSLFPQFTFHLGGEHGENVSRLLELQIGTTGAFVVCIVLALCYIIYFSSKAIIVLRTMLNPTGYIKEHLPKRTPKDASATDADADENAATAETGDIQQVYTDEGPLTVDLTTGEVLSATDAATPTDENDAENPDETTSEDSIIDINEVDEDAIAPALDDTDATDTDAAVNTETSADESFTVEAGVDEEKADGATLEDVKLQGPYDPKKDLENYKYPSLNLLMKYEGAELQQNDEELKANKDRITQVLKNFGVEISSIKATIGPTITLYEITPAPGVKIAKIRNLENDIALNLSAIGVRIIAPIPGKGTIGIEVPNQKPLIVSMESILNSKKFQDTTFDLPIALGKTITNEVFMVDLAKMPHLLVAGATGQGKSVGLNAIITSLLYKKHPAELKIVMVDPKKVEFSIYAPIENHFLAKIPAEGDAIITDVTKVIQTLNSLCQEMDTRYDLLKKARVRNLKEYNAKFIARQLNPEHGHHFMPYIVVVIDEFGDLIMTAGKEVELPIARIAQLARAVGMHMIIATQRPTTNIITGTIKANFPARMAFKVMSQIDSRTILDCKGADQLVGKGDMLFLAGNTPTRVQCAFVDTPEVEQICQHIACQQGYLSAFELPEPAMEESSSGGSGESVDSGNLDPMFADAAREIVVHQQGSTSLIQRRFSIGYNRAGRLMDQMEKVGIVGPARGAKPREVYCADLAELEIKLNSL